MAYSFKGVIAFGLVYIPAALVARIKNNDIGFNMIDKKTMSRVKYKKHVWIAKTVLRTKETLLLLRVKDGNLIADTLFLSR